MSDSETLKVYADKAEDYARTFAQSGVDRHLAAFIEGLPEHAHVLDLGCGPGQAARKMIDAGFKVDAWDASAEMAATGRKLFDIEIEVRSFDTLDSQGSYDGIYANFSLLHAEKSQMPGLLARIARALKSSGLLHIGLKTGIGEKRDHLGRFYAFYQDDELTGLLSEAGLVVTSRATGADLGLAGTRDPWIIMKAIKKDD